MLSDELYSEGFTKERLQAVIARYIGYGKVPAHFKILTDTSDFSRVDYDDVVILGGCPYLVRNNEREGGFGIDEQQKFWVKRAST